MAKLNLAAVILAAGTSSRMGKNKLALPWGEDTVLEATMAMAERVDFDQRVLVLGFEQEYWLKHWQTQLEQNQFPWQIVINETYQQGQGTSVAKAAKLLQNFPQCQGAMFFLGDQPLIRPQTIQQLQQSWRQQPKKIFVPTYQGKRGNPVLFPAWAFAEMAQLGADEGARGLLTRYAEQVHFEAVNDEGILLDLDTPVAYQAALAAWQKRKK